MVSYINSFQVALVIFIVKNAKAECWFTVKERNFQNLLKKDLLESCNIKFKIQENIHVLF